MAGGFITDGKGNRVLPKPPPAPMVYRVAGYTLATGMWLWMMYRIKEDMPTVLGWRHPWDGHGHDDKHH